MAAPDAERNIVAIATLLATDRRNLLAAPKAGPSSYRLFEMLPLKNISPKARLLSCASERRVDMRSSDLNELADELAEFAPVEKAVGRPASEERVIAGFEEVQRFVEEHGSISNYVYDPKAAKLVKV